MSDLRAALEKYRDSMVGPENIWPATMTPAMVAAQLDLFLAAHPDETGTEPVGGLDELARHWRVTK